MSVYTVTIALGPDGSAPTHTWTIDNGDVPNPADTTQVLDGLTITGWSIAEADPFPGQPDPPTARLQLLLDDVAELADVGVGAIANILIESAGTLVGQFSGRVAQPSTRIVRRRDAGGNTVRKVLFDIPLVDFVADLSSVTISGSWPQESIFDRSVRIRDAITAASGLTVNPLPPASGQLLAALEVTDQPARDVLIDFLRQDVFTDDYGRSYLVVDVQDDSGTFTVGYDSYNFTGFMPDAPGHLVLTDHVLGIVFDGTTPAPAGLTIDSGRVEESGIVYTALKYNAITRVKVTGPAGTVSVSNGLPDGGELAIATDLVTLADYEALARTYLPPADENRWQMDSFTWRPTDADLAGLDYPLIPCSQWDVGPGSPWTRIVQVAPVVITPLDPAITPGVDSPFVGGILTQITLSIRRGVLSVTGRLARRLLATSAASVTVADVVANFPTVKLKTGTDVVDPALSVYESKLARKM